MSLLFYGFILFYFVLFIIITVLVLAFVLALLSHCCTFDVNKEALY